MASKTRDEILGFEYDWLACDADDHVALFSTAGGGLAPEEFLRDTEAHDAAIDATLAAPACTIARFAPILPPNCGNAWRAVAERGLFAFDSDFYGGPYRIDAAPERPVRVADLPEAVATVVKRIRLQGLRFAEMREIPAQLVQQHESA